MNQYLSIFISIICFILIFATYKYLSNLENCSCVKEKTTYEKTIENLKIYELIILFLPIFMLIIMMIFPSITTLYLMLFFAIGLDLFFLKNAFDFMEIAKTCPCAKKKIRYFIYWQVFSIFALFFSIIIKLIVNKELNKRKH